VVAAGAAVAAETSVAAGAAVGWATGLALLGAAHPANARAKMIRPKKVTRTFRLVVENRLVMVLSFLSSLFDRHSSHLYL
jgi:hypothetical protein